MLVGDIGPRPLLPRDQPSDPRNYWRAQVNGGNLLCAEEKDALDEWYIRNASLQLDVRITFMTLRRVFQGERISKAAINEAFAMRRRHCVVVPLYETCVTPMVAPPNPTYAPAQTRAAFSRPSESAPIV